MHLRIRPAWNERPAPAKSRPRLLFVAEAVSLAHVGRPLVLARWAREAGYEVHFACGAAYAALVREAGFEPIPLTTIVPTLFYSRVTQGKFFYTENELEGYVQAERALLARLRPGLVIGDFRLSLDISTTLAGVPLLALNNAQWSPAAACRFPAPRHGLFGRLPPGPRERLFDLLRPLAFRVFAAPLNRVRRRFGLPALHDFRELYTAGNGCAYLDLPEFMPLAGPLPPGHFYLGPVVWEPCGEPPNRFTTEAQRHGDKTEQYVTFHSNKAGHGTGSPQQTAAARGTLQTTETVQRYIKSSFSVPPCLRGEHGSARPLAYVSLGSSGEKGVLPQVLRALVAQGCDAVLSGVDEHEQARLREAVPGWDRHVAAVRLLDPRAVLARAALCVCHGGSGTVYQSLSYGVPLVCLPGNPDQGLVAQAVEASGAGVALDPGRARGSLLAEVVAKVRQSATYRKNAQRSAEALARHDTRGRWTDFLALVGKMSPDHRPRRANSIPCLNSSQLSMAAVYPVSYEEGTVPVIGRIGKLQSMVSLCCRAARIL